MSIYISGLEFPKVPTFIILLPDGQVEIPSQARMAKAMPVPSHGELIDRDALLESEPEFFIPNYNSDGYLADGEGAYISVQIEDAPTIIPADKEEWT